MLTARYTFSLRILAVKLLAFAFTLLPLKSLAQARADPVAPTQTDDPATIDGVWQMGSSKYDSARNAILKQVDKINSEGPFRTDWESLQTYKVPDCYKDAKFYFTKYPGRFISMHVQGWSAETKKVTAVGQDTLDWKKIFAAAKTGGIKNYFVEMSLATMKASVPYLRKLQV